MDLGGIIHQIWSFLDPYLTPVSTVLSLVGSGGLYGAWKWLRHRGKAKPARRPESPLFQLPRLTEDFIGRKAEVAALAAALDGPGAIVCVEGMAGIGKTELVVAAAQRLAARGRFRQGQLYVDLRGYGAQRPVTTVQALHALIAGFQLNAALPKDEGALATLWRGMSAGRDMLVVLDNARDEAQVRPLLPGGDRCTVAVIARSRMGLGQPFDVKPLQRWEARKLAQRIGNRRQADRLNWATADRLAELCGREPLAVVTAARAVAAQDNQKVERFLERLADAKARRGILGVVIEALAWSLEGLPAEDRARWPMLAVFTDRFTIAGAAAVWQAEDADAEDSLTRLYTTKLVDFSHADRAYHLHPVQRDLAARELDPDPDRAFQARFRHAAVFLAVLQEAEQRYRAGGEETLRGLALLDEHIEDIELGRQWVFDHRNVRDDIKRMMVEYPLQGILENRYGVDENISWMERAVEAAAELGIRDSLAYRFIVLAVLYDYAGSLDKAWEIYQGSLNRAEVEADRRIIAANYHNMAVICKERGELDRAEEMLRHAISINEELGNSNSLSRNYSFLGVLKRTKSLVDEELECYQKSLGYAEQVQDWYMVFEAQVKIANAQMHSGNYGVDTKSTLASAFEIALKINDRRAQAECHRFLGAFHLNTSDFVAAEQHLRLAVKDALDYGDLLCQAASLQLLGFVTALHGMRAEAETHYRMSLDRYRALGHQEWVEEVERALADLAEKERQAVG